MFYCKYCEYTSNWSSNLRRHEKTKHNGGSLMKMGYITVGYMTQKVINIVEILTNLLCKVWHK